MTARPDPAGLAALAGAGALVGHEIGYLAAADAGAGHGHIAWLMPIALGVAIVGFWASAVSVLRRLPTPPPSIGALTAVQVAAYIVLEVGERAAGFGGSLFSLPVLLGLLAQPLVAWAALRLLHAGRRVVEHLLTARLAPMLVPRPTWTIVSAARPLPALVPVAPARGPPGLR